MKRLSLVLLFSALALCMLNFTGGNLHSDAQIAPNAPGGVQSIPSSPSLSTSSPVPLSPSSTVPLGVKITSHTTGQQVPTGQLTISGTSTDTPNANCEVYTDVNDLKPMQKVAASGPGGNNDYSAWTFTYTPAYSLIKNGTNNLTSKISCIDSSTTTGNLTKWNSVNVTGVDGLVLQQTPPSIISAVGNNTNNTGLLISQSAALGTFDPTVATATSGSNSNNDNSNDDDDDNDNNSDDSDNDSDDSDNDNSDIFVNFEESNEEESNDDDDQQDNEETDEETNTLNDDENSEEEDNDANLASSDNTDDQSNDESATVANTANDDVDNESNNVNSNPGSSSEDSDDENAIVESNSARNDEVNSAPERNEGSTINENNVNENPDLFANEESADVASESETNEESNDEDECDIGDRGFPFCDGRID